MMIQRLCFFTIVLLLTKPLYCGKKVMRDLDERTFATLSQKKQFGTRTNFHTSFRTLRCNNSKMTSLEGIRRYSNLHRINHLDFSNNYLTDFYELVHLKNTSVRIITLTKNYIEHLYANDLQQLLLNFTALDYIDLRENMLCPKEIAAVTDQLFQTMGPLKIQIDFDTPKI